MGVVGRLRARVGEPEHAGLRRLVDPGGLPVDGMRNWSSGWLPAIYQGTPFRSGESRRARTWRRPRACRPRPARVSFEFLEELNRCTTSSRHAGKQRARSADRQFRDRRARCRRPCPRPSTSLARDRGHAAALRPRQAGDAGIRHAAACWPAAWSSGRPFRSDLHERPALGHAQQERRDA